MPQFPSAPLLLVLSLLTTYHNQSLGQDNGKTGGWVYFVMISLLQLFLPSYTGAQAAILSQVHLLLCLLSVCPYSDGFLHQS